MKCLNLVALILIIIGGLNWLLIGVFHFNLVNMIFGKLGFIENIVYIAIGIGALICIPMLKNCCPKVICKKD